MSNIRKGISREKVWVGDNARSHTWIFIDRVSPKKKKKRITVKSEFFKLHFYIIYNLPV